MKSGYEYSRRWFDFCFENPEKIKPVHTALYFFCIEHCNRLGWKEKFGLPTTMAKEAIGVHSYNTYIYALNNLVEWGFILLIEKSKNQYSSNIIALSNFNKALYKALDKASIKHSIKQEIEQGESIVQSNSESTVQSICSINKHITINKELFIEKYPTVEIFKNDFKNTDWILFDLSVYYELMKNHYSLKSEKRDNWRNSVINWLVKDRNSGKAIFKPQNTDEKISFLECFPTPESCKKHFIEKKNEFANADFNHYWKLAKENATKENLKKTTFFGYVYDFIFNDYKTDKVRYENN